MPRESWVMVETLESRQLLSVVPAGPAFEVAGPGVGNAAIAADANGNLVVASAQGSQVVAQRFDAAGDPVGQILIVGNGGTDGEGPRVAMNAAGSFVVTWDQWVSLKNGGGNWQVHAREFNATTQTLGNDLLVQGPDYDAHLPAVAVGGNGAFVVTWRDTSTGMTNSGKPTNVYARLYSASGTALGRQFQVNTSGGATVESRPAMDSAGDFVIAWHDSTLGEVFARRYNSSGAAVSGQFAVGNNTSLQRNSVDVAMDSTGDFLIAWQDAGTIDAQRYLASGAAQWSAPMQLDGDGAARFVRDSLDGAGNGIIAWTEQDAAQGEDVYEQQLDGAGTPLGGVANVTPYNPATGGSAVGGFEGIVAQPDDEFVLLWVDNQGGASQPGLWGQQDVQQ